MLRPRHGLRAPRRHAATSSLATMRNTPEHAFLWLGSAYAGTILSRRTRPPARPSSTGWSPRSSRALVLRDADVAALFAEEPEADAGIGPGAAPTIRRC